MSAHDSESPPPPIFESTANPSTADDVRSPVRSPVPSPGRPSGSLPARWRSVLIGMLSLACLASLAVLFWSRAIDHPVSDMAAGSEVAETRAVAAARQRFFDESVLPTIETADRQNRQAARRALAKWRSTCDRYRSGVDPLVDDLLSWSTRYGVLKRMPGDWYRRTDRVEQFVQGKIHRRLFSDQTLAHDVRQIVSAFGDDVRANQTAMLADIRAAVMNSDLPTLAIRSGDEVSVQLDDVMRRRGTDAATRSLTRGVMAEVAGLAGGFVAEQLIAQAAVRLAAMSAGGAAASGGVTATAAAAGGGGGTVAGGPLGTAVGIAGGLVAGVVIDWYASKRLRRELTIDLRSAIAQVQSTVVADLEPALWESCDTLAAAYDEVCRREIIRAVPPAIATAPSLAIVD